MMKLLRPLAFLLLLINYSCQNDKSTTVSEQNKKPETKVTDQKSKPKSDLYKLGIDDNPDNALGGLKVGDTAPNFSLNDSNGKTVSLYALTEKNPTIITFYRAHWCGYCTKQLAEFQDEIEDLKSAGTNILAISPELPKHSKTVIEDKGLSYPILFDEHHEVAKAYKVLFHVNQMYQDRLQDAKQKSIAEVNGDLEAKMPIPATYVIGKDNRIKYTFYNPDYSKRAPISELKNAIASL